MKILVIGDVIIDINYFANSVRTASEAQIPVYNIFDTQFILGGAGNVAKNIKNLNIDIELISVIGDDYYGRKIKKILNQNKIQNKLFIDENRLTTQKYRIFKDNKIVNRHDFETKNNINAIIELQIINFVKEHIMNYDAIVFSDYNKGVLTVNLCRFIIEQANLMNTPVFVDPKINNIEKYLNCFCFKPNIKESHILTNESELFNIFSSIKNKTNAKNIVITDGENGIYLNSPNNFLKSEKKNAIDVTGAGDVALCILLYVWLQEKNMSLACEMANYICGKSVETIGNYNISINDINEFYLKNKIIYFDNNEEKLNNIIKLKKNNKLVFTNGCFDIIHSAHMKLLKFCRNKGDIFILGLNSDNSIKKNKGKNRPINNEKERIDFLTSLEFIDSIIIFDDETPNNLIKILKPNILIKGGDYKKDEIIGREYADETIIFDYINEKSTTNIIKKINQSNILNI